MSKRPGAVQFLFPGMEPEEGKQPGPARENTCEVRGKSASFGFRSPGWHGLKEPCRWRCFKHRIETNADRGE